jgi:hypothetical protein
MSGDQSVFLAVKISTNEFIDLNPPYQELSMFEVKEEPSTNKFFDFTALNKDVDIMATLVEIRVDDSDFGEIYAIIGKFSFKSDFGLLVVLHRDVVKKLAFKNQSSLQLILFKSKVEESNSKSCNSKIARRLIKTATKRKEIFDSFYFELCIQTVLIIPTKGGGNISRSAVASVWNSYFGWDLPPTDHVCNVSKNLKRKHSIMMDKDTATSLNDSTASTRPQSTVVQKKTLKSILSDGKVSHLNVEVQNKKKTTINLREEAVSVIEGAFEDRWSPEDFVDGFSALKRSQPSPSRPELAAISASILMDASYRITDCTPYENEDMITDFGIDVDQVKKNVLSTLFLFTVLCVKYLTRMLRHCLPVCTQVFPAFFGGCERGFWCCCSCC